MSQETRIHLAPAHPYMGWVSMNRYWQALVKESSGDHDVASLVSGGPVEAGAKSRWQGLWTRRVVYPWIVRSQVRSGVLHVLDHSFADLLAHVRPSVRTVVTVHDLIPLTDPADLTAAQYARFRKTVACLTRADCIVCVSDYTKSEVQRLLQVPDEKLHVLPNGSSALPPQDLVMKERMTKLPTYIFSVGGTRPRKNLRLLPPLMKHLAEMGYRATLVRAGGKLEAELAREIRLHANLHELGPVNDGELAACYAGAGLTLIPSTQEGFGMPVLEAMNAGCPVVYSLATSLPEVAGDAGLGFDPRDTLQAAHQCYRIFTDTDLRSQLIELGHRRAGKFSWKAHWLGLRRLYGELLSS